MTRHGIVVFAFVLAAGLLLGGDLDAGSLEPPGPPAPTMKTIEQAEPRTPISSLPFTISSPGSYYLTGNLTGVSGQAGITIMASYVTLDLNGFSLIGVAGSLDGINSSLSVLEHLVIRNGVIRNWGGRGLSSFDTTEVHAEDLRLLGNGGDGLRVGPRSIVRNTTSSGNAGYGIWVNTGSVVNECTTASNAQGGVVAQYSLVSNSTALLHGATFGFSLAGSSATDCTAQQNLTGFSMAAGGRVVRSLARVNGTGIFAADTSSVEDCTADSNTDIGIRMSNRGLARGNVASLNTNIGIYGITGNRIEDNHTTQNGVGIQVVGINNLIVNNSAIGNTTEFSIPAGNKAGPISADPTTAGHWANFDL